MTNKFKDFPQYRMILGRKVYYKIISEREFIEISWIGSKQKTYVVKAEKYPELLKIMDMLNCVFPFEVLSKEQFKIVDL